MNTSEATQLLMTAVGHAADGDADQAADALQKLGASGDNSQMFGACCALGEVATMALKKVYGDRPAGSMFTFTELVPGAMAEDPCKAFSVRFITAWANGDRDTAMALFNAALASEGDQYVQSVCALLADTAGIMRLALAPGPDGAT